MIWSNILRKFLIRLAFLEGNVLNYLSVLKYYELDIENHNYYCVRQEPRQASPVRFMLKTTLTAVIEEKKKASFFLKKRKLAMGA